MQMILVANFLHGGRLYKAERNGRWVRISYGLTPVESFKDGHASSPLELEAQKCVDIVDPILIEFD